MELTRISDDYKKVNTFEKRDLVRIILQALVVVVLVYTYTSDILLANLVFLITLFTLWYVHIGGFVRGMVVQYAHSGSSFPTCNLDFEGHFGIWKYGAWDMLKRERIKSEHNKKIHQADWDKKFKERKKNGE